MLNPAGEKMWERDLPHFVMAADASADGGTVVAALFDGRVAILDAEGDVRRIAGVPGEATLTGIVVAPDGDAVWLSTWDGRLLRCPL